MPAKWTDEQKAAIDSKGQNLLLSAAAGSGKTAVLVERIISRITDKNAPVDADKLLVVTFTNAAANEMRERIIKALDEEFLKNPQDELIKKQLVLIKKAQITTIDSFCIDVLRKYFVEADLSPDFSVADPTECAVILEDALDNVINKMYDDKEYGKDFLNLMESYANSKANDKVFRDLLVSIYKFSMSLPYPYEWLSSAAEKFNIKGNFNDSEYKEVIINEAHAECSRIVSEYSIMAELAQKDLLFDYLSLINEEKSFFLKCLDIFDYDELKNILDSFEFKRRPAISKKLTPVHINTINEMRDKIKKKRMGKLCEKLLNLTAYQQEISITKMYPCVKCLSVTVRRLAEEYLELKRKKNILDFSDCEHFCLNVLVKDGRPTDVANIIRKKYNEIYIDEYQDTSKLQEAIFASVKSENNLFMVGDIKQSIYRFRNTDPTLFKEKRDKFSKDIDAFERKIILSKNFRSRENVLASVNCIFERIMSEESGEIDYNDDERLNLGADFPDESINPISYDTEIAIIDTKTIQENEEEEVKKTELEAIYCAKRISDLIKSEVQIYDKGEYRKIKYSDFCIIARNVKDNAVVLNAVFSEFGIPCYSENTGGYFASREVEIMLCMLSVIDNPYQDLPLLAVLRSIMFNVSSDELAKIRIADKRKTFYDAVKACSITDTPEGATSKNIIKVIETFCEKSKRLSVSELILDIYNTTGYFEAQQAMSNGIIRRQNLMILYNRAKEYEKTGLKGLYSFVKFISDYKNTGNDLDAAKIVVEQQDAVRIMSIHKSKGLEFPVVILFGAERRFNMMDMHRSVLYHADLGFGPKFIDSDLRITYKFAPRAALESVLYRESIAEEMRILYVALTRAKEKLIIIGADRNIKQKVRNCLTGDPKKRINGALVSEHTSYLDWILMSVIDHSDCGVLRSYVDTDRENYIYKDESVFKVKIISDQDELFFEKMSGIHITKEKNPETENLLSLLEFKYPNISDTKLPSKITVTELKKRKEHDILLDGIEVFKRRNKIKEEKNTGLTSAQIGIAYHTIMQKYDITMPIEDKEDVKAQIEIIREKGFLTEEEAGAVNPEKILKFYKSGIGKMVLNADSVKREVMFGVSIPARQIIAETTSDKEIMLQGVIDCILDTPDGLVIIDYKTDRSYDESDTVEKYRIQLDCYKYAAEKLFKKPVIRKILYMFETDTGLNL